MRTLGFETFETGRSAANAFSSTWVWDTYCVFSTKIDLLGFSSFRYD